MSQNTLAANQQYGACLVTIHRSIWVYRMDISRSNNIIDRENLKIKKRKISEEQNIQNKGYDQASGKTHINIRTVFQRWRNLNEQEGFESDAEVALFLFDRRVMLILHCFTKHICVGLLCLNMLVCHLCLFSRLSLCQGCVRTCVAEIST